MTIGSTDSTMNALLFYRGQLRYPMIIVIGTLGFISGFILGQLILLKLLRNVSSAELLENKGMHWKYGLLNWAVAVLTAWSAVWLYNQYFLHM